MANARKILLVEDDPAIVRMYSRRLTNDGYEVRTAQNGEEGLAAIKESPPDIALLDIMMPKMSGLDALRAIKSDSGLKDIPVVILTNLGDREDDIRMCKELGAEDYWVKVNMNINELSGKIAKIISVRP